MDKEILFRDIRRQEVVLWAGSGFSRYAGYPMGSGVVEQLYKALSKQQREQLARELQQEKPECPDLPLPKFAELFLDLHNGNAHTLNQVVIDLFSARPKSIKTHEQLAQLAFIEHIVTTNYDRLFEEAYRNHIQVVTSGANLPYRKRDKTILYKIHGDVQDPNSLIIAESDYTRFFDKADKALWGRLEALFATHTLVFVGYALEDPNVLDVFMRVLDTLGTNMRPAYLVAPGLSQMRVDRLKRRNVVYIDMTGEQFVEELQQDSKENVLLELKNGEISPEAAFSWLSRNGFDYKGDSQRTGDGFEVRDIWKRDGLTQRKINFTLPADSPLIQTLEDYREGKGWHPLKLTIKEEVQFRFETEGIHIPQDIQTVWIARAPSLEKEIDVRFEGGLMIPSVSARIYRVDEDVRLVASTPRMKLSLTMPLDVIRSGGNYRAKFTRRTITLESVQAGLEESDVLMAIGSGEAFSCYENGRVVWSSPKREPSGHEQSGEEMRTLMQALQRIEKAFSIVFKHFETDEHYHAEIYELDGFIRQQKRNLTSWIGEAKLVLSEPYDPIMVELMAGRGGEAPVGMELREEKTFNVLGWELSVEALIRYIVPLPILTREGESNTFVLTSAERILVIEVAQIIETKVVSSPTVLSQPIPLPDEPSDLDDFHLSP